MNFHFPSEEEIKAGKVTYGFDPAKQGTDSTEFFWSSRTVVFPWKADYNSAIYKDSVAQEFSYHPEPVNPSCSRILMNPETFKKYAAELNITKLPEANSDGTLMGMPFCVRSYVPENTIILVVPGTHEHPEKSIRIIKIAEQE